MLESEELRMCDERWAPIPGWEAYYEVSTHGRVRRLAVSKRQTQGQVLRVRHRATGLEVCLSQPRILDPYRPQMKRVVCIWPLVARVFGLVRVVETYYAPTETQAQALWASQRQRHALWWTVTVPVQDREGLWRFRVEGVKE